LQRAIKLAKNVFELKIMLKLIPEYDVRVSVLGHMQPVVAPVLIEF
jgi:hypothetical protein